MPDDALRLDGISKAFARGSARVSVLTDVSLSVAPGEIVAVVGTRDQGKTTLIRVAAGMLAPDSGRVYVRGRELTYLNDRQLAGILASDISVATRAGPEPRMTAKDYVEMSIIAARTKLRRKNRRSAVDDVLRRLDIAAYADLGWSELSSWQRVVVELAQAIVIPPKVLLVDDLTDGIGLGKKQAAMELIEDVTRDFGCGVLLAVSDHAAALKASRVWQLRGGRVKLMHAGSDVIPIEARRIRGGRE